MAVVKIKFPSKVLAPLLVHLSVHSLSLAAHLSEHSLILSAVPAVAQPVVQVAPALDNPQFAMQVALSWADDLQPILKLKWKLGTFWERRSLF